MKTVLKVYLFGTIITALTSCDYGPKATLNEEFILADRYKELPFQKLVGVYKLDENSKKRYSIPDSINLSLDIRKDSMLYAPNYINVENRRLKNEEYENKLFYINHFNQSSPILDLSIPKPPYFNGNGIIDIYYRKKDSAIALYVLTPFIPASKENNFQYKEADYLRYIKVK